MVGTEKDIHWQSLSTEQAIQLLNSNAKKGLSTPEAVIRLQKHGYNKAEIYKFTR